MNGANSEVSKGVGIPIVIDTANASVVVNMWSVHLEWTCYGPYAAFLKEVRASYSATQAFGIPVLGVQLDADHGGRGCLL